MGCQEGTLRTRAPGERKRETESPAAPGNHLAVRAKLVVGEQQEKPGRHDLGTGSWQGQCPGRGAGPQHRGALGCTKKEAMERRRREATGLRGAAGSKRRAREE